MLNKKEGPLTLGIDLGGTKIALALVAATGEIMASEIYPTHPEKGADGIIEDILKYVRGCLARTHRTASALGVGVAGQIDRDTGVVRFSPNLGWQNVAIRDRLQPALGMPVTVTNDVRAATWGEWQYGAGRGVNDLVCVFVGTGIGGGIVSGGHLLEGCCNTAGELGHVTVVAGGRQCHCPNRGCLEAYAGGWAIAERAKEAVRRDPTAGAQLQALAGNLDQLSAATVTQAYRLRDPLAVYLVEETARYLAAGVITFVNALNPCLIILGGGVIEGLPEYITLIEPMVRAGALQSAVDGLKLVRAGLGDKAVVVGAAALARHSW